MEPVAHTHPIVPEVWAHIISKTSFLKDWKSCSSINKAALLGVNLLAADTLNNWYCAVNVQENKFSPFKRILHLENLMIEWVKEPEEEEQFVITSLKNWRRRFEKDTPFYLTQFHYYIHRYFLTKTRQDNILNLLANEIVPSLKKLNADNLTFQRVPNEQLPFLVIAKKSQSCFPMHVGLQDFQKVIIGNNPLLAVEMDHFEQLQFILKLTVDQNELEEALFLAIKVLKINFFNLLFSKLKLSHLEDKIIDEDLKILMSADSNPLKVFQTVLTKILKNSAQIIDSKSFDKKSIIEEIILNESEFVDLSSDIYPDTREKKESYVSTLKKSQNKRVLYKLENRFLANEFAKIMKEVAEILWKDEIKKIEGQIDQKAYLAGLSIINRDILNLKIEKYRILNKLNDENNIFRKQKINTLKRKRDELEKIPFTENKKQKKETELFPLDLNELSEVDEFIDPYEEEIKIDKKEKKPPFSKKNVIENELSKIRDKKANLNLILKSPNLKNEAISFFGEEKAKILILDQKQRLIERKLEEESLFSLDLSSLEVKTTTLGLFHLFEQLGFF